MFLFICGVSKKGLTSTAHNGSDSISIALQVLTNYVSRNEFAQPFNILYHRIHIYLFSHKIEHFIFKRIQCVYFSSDSYLTLF